MEWTKKKMKNIENLIQNPISIEVVLLLKLLKNLKFKFLNLT